MSVPFSISGPAPAILKFQSWTTPQTFLIKTALEAMTLWKWRTFDETKLADAVVAEWIDQDLLSTKERVCQVIDQLEADTLNFSRNCRDFQLTCSKDDDTSNKFVVNFSEVNDPDSDAVKITVHSLLDILREYLCRCR